MLRKLVPALLALFGLAAGAGAGLLLRPTDLYSVPASMNDARSADAGQTKAPSGGKSEPAGQATDSLGGKGADKHSAPAEKGDKPIHDYVKLNNQFVVPVVQNGRVAALVILSLSLEVKAGTTAKVYQVEPKLRDGFLQVMFDHANAGGFMGTFTDGSNMVLLREALGEVAQSILGPEVTDVLIVDIVRQDS